MDPVDVEEAALSLREQVAQRVRAEIISGRNTVGRIYTVPTLASELGVSNTPVREALLELARAGLLTPKRNRGFIVRSPTLQDLRDLFALRDVIETFAMVTLAGRRLHDPADITPLADAVAQSVERGDQEAYLEADRAFHHAMIERAGNRLLTETAMTLRDNMRLYGIGSAAGRQRQLDSVAEHYRLIELAAAGDRDGIGALTSHHIRSWEPIFTAAMSSKASKPLSRGTTVGLLSRSTLPS